MKKKCTSVFMALSFISLLSALTLAPGWVSAASRYLISQPIPTSSGGATCACINMLKKPIILNIQIRSLVSTVTSYGVEIDPGGIQERVYGIETVAYCKVWRNDLELITTKQVRCTMSATDLNNAPIIVEPVNIKAKR